MVVRIELDIGLYGMEIWKRTDKVGELDIVIPDKNFACQLSPGHQVTGKFRIRLKNWPLALAFNVA